MRGVERNRMRLGDREPTPLSLQLCILRSRGQQSYADKDACSNRKNCKYATLTEAKSAKPTGQSLDTLLDSVVTKESLLSAVEQPLWSSSDAAELSAPTGEGRHLNKDRIFKSTQQKQFWFSWENNLTL